MQSNKEDLAKGLVSSDVRIRLNERGSMYKKNRR